MNKKICITSTKSVGCTFLDWSIHFLSGQDNFYNVNSEAWLPISSDPITVSNAHGHSKNHPHGQKECKIFFDKFDTLDPNRFYSAYPIRLHMDTAASELKINLDNFSNEYDNIVNYIMNDYNQMLETCYQQNAKLIFVATNPTAPFYFLNVRSLDRWLLKPGQIDSVDAAIDEIQNAFFKESINAWNNSGLCNAWDIRERRALDLRILSNPDEVVTNFKSPHLWVDCLDVWTRGDIVIQTIMDYVELSIIPEQFERWLPIFKKWQKIQLNEIQFDYNYNHIIDSIINNWYYKINLTFEQEIVIQHFLIYKHNLNLKTWQLEKFPNNTQELHKLLEPNIHPVAKIY